MANQTGKTALLLHVEGLETVREMLYLQSKTVKRSTRYALDVDVHRCADVEVSLAPLICRTSVVTT